MEFWKTLTAPVIATAVGGIIVGIVVTKVTGPETSNLTAEIRWVEIPNPIFHIPAGMNEPVEKAFKAMWGDDAVYFLKFMRDSTSLRISQIDVENNSNVRSKEIEFASKPMSLVFSDHAKDGQPQFRNTIKLKSVDPKSKIQVIELGGLSVG